VSDVSLKSAHIYLPKEIVERIFGDVNFAYVTYVKEQQNLLLTPVSSVWFTKVYEPKQLMLKSRNLHGDKTAAIHELLIDHELDGTDRQLTYEIIDRTKLIKIDLS